MTEDQFSTGDGFTRTAHGAQVHVTEALSWPGGDTRVMAVVLNSVKAVIVCIRTKGNCLSLSNPSASA